MKVKLLHPKAKLPSKGTADSAGYDISLIEDAEIAPGETKKLPSGLAVALPPMTWGMIRSRSSSNAKGLRFDGVIDSDYRGEVKLVCTNVGKETQRLEAGRCYAQLIVMLLLDTRVEQAETLDDTARGAGGFGSTGNS